MAYVQELGVPEAHLFRLDIKLGPLSAAGNRNPFTMLNDVMRLTGIAER